ncbi:undecaprenyl-diphosphatase UppP [Candidatus Dojkabacteria bacterium]|uniref:Undecaprenyl-diphosphatase n=1 Tax=Candidatus Dojkabacteria bacterium TaxID=2099670 RepID=A0A955L729_9BACT|nr:undecaprenyl-diphosphatase UppP [Candidatus Dojkabacteria bacterium]
MTLQQTFILGILQGVTEFIPVSSSGHLLLFPFLFGWDVQPTAFDIVVHIGTLAALLIYFRKKLFLLLRNSIELVHQKKTTSLKNSLAVKIAIGTLPAIFVGALFTEIINETFKSPLIASLSLITIGILFLVPERLWKSSKVDLKEISTKDSIIIGLFQVLAFIRGTSRSGITILGGLVRGLTREQATEFSFLLGIPIIALAGAYELININELLQIGIPTILVGLTSSFLSGYLAITFMMKFVKKHGLLIFGVYRIILGIIVITTTIR